MTQAKTSYEYRVVVWRRGALSNRLTVKQTDRELDSITQTGALDGECTGLYAARAML